MAEQSGEMHENFKTFIKNSMTKKKTRSVLTIVSKVLFRSTQAQDDLASR